jgi:eukaryotic-like serine/threonine-protein kinase
VGSPVSEPLSPQDPREIGPFTIVGLLGAGGMGEVYLGRYDGRYAAVKRVRSRLVSIERFNREVAILHRVPLGVAPAILASDSTTWDPWLATEYVPGLTVDEAVRSLGPLPADSLWLLLSEIATHLQAVHRAGIVHRDLKPANIMLVHNGVKLIDFGIALAADQSRLTRVGASSGTHGFVAPEQDAGSREAAAPADVYSLGATLVYAASTATPYAMPDIENLRAVDAELADIAESWRGSDPEARPSAADLAASARSHIGDASLSWPAPVMGQIAVRRSFAMTPVEEFAVTSMEKMAKLAKMDTVLPTEPGPTEPRPGRRPMAGWRRFAIPVLAVAALGGAGATVLALSPGTRTSPKTNTNANMSPSTKTSPSTSPNTNTKAGSSPSTAPPSLAPSPTSSPIAGINSADDAARVSGSEIDVDYVAGDAACSAWLDTDGAGRLAGVLNTSLYQSCSVEVLRSDGMTFTFSASQGAEKTNYLPDWGNTTMRICVWHANDKSDQKCSPLFAMNGTTPAVKA